VIAIIAILAAMLLPALARAKARRATHQLYEQSQASWLGLPPVVDRSRRQVPVAGSVAARGYMPGFWR